ncbi:transporter [Pelomonas sp. HMWF004]|nr:transporter [Pelomonas sp. HMWF004]
MKIAQLATLLTAAALAATPLASHAQDNAPGNTAANARVWVKDSVITTKIKAQLAASKISSLTQVQVETDANGHVQLTGKVANPAEKDRAESIAKAIEGVTAVDNQLTVSAM